MLEALNKEASPNLGSDDGSNLSHQFSVKSDARGYDSEILLNERLCICLASGYSITLRMMIIDDWAEMKKSSLPNFNNPADAARAWADQFEQRMIAEKEKEVIQLQLEEAKPKVEFYDAVTDSTDAVDLGTAAKVLNLGFGRTTLFEKLRDNKILMKNNQPFQRYIDGGWFRVIETSWTHPSGDTHVNFKTVVYQKGLDGIRKLLSTENF